MFYGNSVQDTRTMYFTSWHNYQQQKPLSSLEQQIVQVILDHPEYHAMMEQNNLQDYQYFPELGQSNPFLHMGLHLAIREQITTNRPSGIHAAFQQLMAKYKDPLAVEHLMMDRLAECLWLAQKNNSAPDEHAYLEHLSQL